MKLIKNISFLVFIALFINACEEDTETPDTTDDLLVGSWNWVSSYEAALDSEGQIIMENTTTPDSLNTWVLTMNDDGSWSEVRLDRGYGMTDSGTWSSSDGIITLTFDEEDEDHDHGDDDHGDHDHDDDDETPQVAYVLSNNSNTLTMTPTFDVDSEDHYGVDCVQITDEGICNETDYYCEWNSDNGTCENTVSPISSVTAVWTFERIE